MPYLSYSEQNFGLCQVMKECVLLIQNLKKSRNEKKIKWVFFFTFTIFNIILFINVTTNQGIFCSKDTKNEFQGRSNDSTKSSYRRARLSS